MLLKCRNRGFKQEEPQAMGKVTFSAKKYKPTSILRRKQCGCGSETQRIIVTV
jgi:hypothetical protein